MWIWNTKHASTSTTIQDHAGGSNNKSTFENYILTIVNPLLCCQTIRHFVRHRQSSMTLIREGGGVESPRCRANLRGGARGINSINGRHPTGAISSKKLTFKDIFWLFIWNIFLYVWRFRIETVSIRERWVSMIPNQKYDVPTPLSQWSLRGCCHHAGVFLNC